MQHFTSLTGTEQMPKQKQCNRIDNGSLKDFSISNTRTTGYPEANHIEVCVAVYCFYKLLYFPSQMEFVIVGLTGMDFQWKSFYAE